MSTARKKAPHRPAAPPKPPACDHCGKPCTKGIVRAASGIYCSPKHKAAREALLAAVAEPKPRADLAVVDAMNRELGPQSTAIARRVAPPILTDSGREVLAAWLEGKSSDTARSYQASARHFATWAREKGYVIRPGSEVDAVIEAFQRPRDQGNRIALEWLRSQTGQNRGSIATRCSGLRMLCTVLDDVGQITYVPSFRRPRKLRRSAMEAVIRFHGVPEAFAAIVTGLQELCSGKNVNPIDLRDLALVVLAGAGVGGRRIELVRLDVSSVDFARSAIWLHGKGRDGPEAFPMEAKSPIVPVLKRWLEVRAKLVGPTGPLLCTMGPQPPAGGRLKRNSINKTLKRRSEQFGVKLRPHDMRRVFCTGALDRHGARKAKDITRHADESTLSLYDMGAGRDMAEMVTDVGGDIMKNVRASAKKGSKKR